MKFTPTRTIAFFSCAFFPLVTLILGSTLFLGGTLLTPFIGIVFFLIPIAVIGILFLLIGSGWKTWIKSILCVGILLVYIPVMGFAILLGTYHSASQYRGSQAMEQYVSASTEVPSLPNPDAY